jgi:N-acetylmuramoyl-L-alanine amidase
MIIDNKHMLIGNVRFVHSPNHSGYLINQQADTIVIHYTGGSSAESSVRSLCNPNSKASAHLVIGRDGTVFQLVPFNQVAWHAGKSQHDETGRQGMNKYSIGIELDNAGALTKKDDDHYISWFGRSYPAKDVIAGVHRNESNTRYWHMYTDVQIAVCLEICRLLSISYPIKYVLGHEEISPGRKIDPGPAFPLETFRNKVIGLDRSDDESEPSTLVGKTAMVNIDRLNIRSGPGPGYSLVRSNPLEYETQLHVLSANGKWLNVGGEGLVGWVNGKYLIAV